MPRAAPDFDTPALYAAHMRMLLVPVLGSAMAFAVACGGESSKSASGRSPEPSTPVSTMMRTGATGIESVDAAIAAVLSGDAGKLKDQVRYTPTACESNPQGIGAPPICQAGEPEGTKVDVFQMAQCEGFYVRPAKLQLEIPASASLYGAYRIDETFWPAGKYAVIFERSQQEAGATAWELILDDEGLVGVHLGCAMAPPQMVSFQRLTDVIIAPGAGAPAPAATP